ncbi:MAG: Unknown protein [uncultured Sulfurovum sp.]|uniref:Uncharacterized protein n=1 Tax=uncultured Sulfurovum sp. TaxID=269237 RepID=A0A6S6T6C9_9BACT|nr:MAG: Unknown protein [uncultured Sulfurovum sp.]
MKYLIFILELIVIVFYVDVSYGTSNSSVMKLDSTNTEYTAYYSEDITNNTILILDNLPENLKLDIWKASPIETEVLSYFPNMQLMQEVYNNRVEDNGLFKSNFLDYMEELQHQYIAGSISEEEFKELFLSPSF